MEERSVQILYHTMKDHLAQVYEKNGWWGRPLLIPEIFESTGPRWSEITDFQLIFARSA